MEIKGRKGQANYTGSYGHTLGANSYKLEVDPSALFTVLFLEKSYFTDYTDDQLISLNYTFLGNNEQIDPLKGVWCDSTIMLKNDKDDGTESKNYTADITIFIALGTPPDAGLYGTLSISVTPQTTSW